VSVDRGGFVEFEEDAHLSVVGLEVCEAGLLVTGREPEVFDG